MLLFYSFENQYTHKMAMCSICHHWWSINFPVAVTHPWRIGMDASYEFTRTYDIAITNQTITTYIIYLGYSTSWEFDAGPISLTFFPAQFKFRWKFRFGFTAFLIQWLLHNFVYNTRAVLSWHLQNLMTNYCFKVRRIFHWIWISNKKLVKGPENQEDQSRVCCTVHFD